MSAVRKLDVGHIRLLLADNDPEFKGGDDDPPEDPILLALCFLLASADPPEPLEAQVRRMLVIWNTGPAVMARFNEMMPIMRQVLAEMQVDGDSRTP